MIWKEFGGGAGGAIGIVCGRGGTDNGEEEEWETCCC